MTKIDPYINERGNLVTVGFYPDRERYHYDLEACKLSDGWEQFDTDQDASYYGVWVNRITFKTLCFAEGDEHETTCPNLEAFNIELEALKTFHEENRRGRKELDREQLIAEINAKTR